MAAVAVAPTAEAGAVRAPGPAVLAILAAVGVAAGASSIAFALSNDSIGAEVGEPLVIASVFTWTTVAYILCGLLAWWRRPRSRFGPLMVWTGFVIYLDTLGWTTTDVSYSVGQAVDKVPPVLLIYAFLAFPSGRLSRPLDRTLVAGAFAVAIVLQLVRMVVGDFGPNNLLGYLPNADVHEAMRKVQLVTLSVCCL